MDGYRQAEIPRDIQVLLKGKCTAIRETKENGRKINQNKK